MPNPNEKFVAGVAVETKEHGNGVIESVVPESADGSNKTFYNVKLDNGDVRHFVESELKLAK